MSTSTLSLRPLDEACIPRFIELASTYFPEGHEARDPGYLRWAFLKNPAGVGRVACAVTPSGKWSAMMGLVPFRIRHGDREFVASMVQNVLVHPDHRNEKLFVGMIRHTCAELSSTNEWLIGHPNEAAVHGWRRTNMGFRPGYEIRVVPPLRGLSGASGTRVRRGSSALLDLDFSPLYEWQRQLGHPVLAADAAFLRWRFLEHPRRSYRLYVHRDAAGVRGYRVDRAFRAPVVRWVIDWQGDDAWAKGPARGPLPALVAWPIGQRAPLGNMLLPRLRKQYYFFATPCASLENDGEPWAHLTLAATDFA